MEQIIPEKELKLSEKQALTNMQEEVAMKKITFDEFEVYYKELKEYIESGAEDYLQYAISLFNALEVIVNKDEEEAFKKQMNELSDIIANKLRNSIENYKINLVDYYANMKKTIKTNNIIPLSEFCIYCDTLRLAMMAKIDGIDFLDWAETLQSTCVAETETLEDSVKTISYRIILGEILEQLEHNTKSPLKR